MVTPSADTTVSNGVYVPGGITNGDVKSNVSTTPLADFLMQLEEYTPTVSRAMPFKTGACCQEEITAYFNTAKMMSFVFGYTVQIY